MPKVFALHLASSQEFLELEKALQPHFLSLIESGEIGIPIDTVASTDVQLVSTIQVSLQEAHPRTEILHLSNKRLLVIRKNKHWIFDSLKGLHSQISDYILTTHQYVPSQLSCRTNDIHLISQFEKNGRPDLTKSPVEWVRDNTFFAALRPKPFYDRLLAFNLDKRGMFLKSWKLRAQHNYFHPSVNSGLPLTKKKDEIHEGTFMMHDMFHFIFFDPIVTGTETPAEKATYIVCRMMSEACTLVLADMIAVAHSGIESLGYDITRRKIYPLFKSLRLDAFDIETVKKVLYANCVYSLHGDTSIYQSFGADEKELNNFTGKYYKFFSGDFEWNEKNIARMTDTMKKNEGLQQYFASLHPAFSAFNTRELTKNITLTDGKLSFDALFSVFWSQLEQLLYYRNESDPIQYRKTAYTKYISGQMYIVYKFSLHKGASNLMQDYLQTIDAIQASVSESEIISIGETFCDRISAFIEALGAAQLLSPVEVITQTLHVTHFPAEYVNYDRPDQYYETLEEISERIMGPFFVREPFRYTPLSSELKQHYISIVSSS